MSDIQRPAPPAGEEVHLPRPTLIPFLTGIGITLLVVGTTLTWLLTGLGALVLLLCVLRWVRDTRRDVAELPEEHG